MAFTKVHQSILQSSLWCEDSDTKVVWITMLALADKHGEIAGSVPGLARTAGVSLEKCQAAITKFLSPDPHSRTPDLEGRRIEAIQGGWALVNHAKYRHEASKDDEKEKNARRQQRHRDKALRGVTRNGKTDEVTENGSEVTGSNGPVTQSRDIADADADADAEALGKQSPKPLLEIVESEPKKKLPAEKDDQSQLEKLRIRVCGIMRRKLTTIWDDKEIKKLKAVLALETPTEDLDALEAYYASDTPYRRKDVMTLLNNWNGEIDRAKQPPIGQRIGTDETQKPVWVQIQELETRIAKHPANTAMIGSAKHPTPEQKEDLRGLRKRLDALKCGQTEFPG